MIRTSLQRLINSVAVRAGGTAALTTTAAAPLVRAAMVRGGVLDVPNHRSSHKAPIPRGGGIACLMGATAGFVVVEASGTRIRSIVPTSLVVTPLAMAALGYADDHFRGLPALPRFGGQLAGGALSATADIPTSAVPVTVIAMPAIVNVVNFMDGINGITGLTAAVWGVNAAILAEARVDATLMGLAAVTAGSGLGFLPWNAPKAQLFLGDTGSYLFGALMATGIVAAVRSPYGLERSPRWSEAYVAAAPLLPYAVDAAQAIARRRSQGADLTEAHREHVYQRLVDTTPLPHLAVSLIHAATAAAVAGAARLPLKARVPLTAAAIGAYLAAPEIAGRLGFTRQPAADADTDSQNQHETTPSHDGGSR